MTFDVAVEILGIEGIADPAGQTVERALPALGFTGVSRLHMGKLVRFELEADDAAAAEATAAALCSELLVNPVIEVGTVTVHPRPTPVPRS